MTPSDPFWLMLVAGALAHGRAPGTYAPRLEHWMLWHYHCLLKGEGFVPMPSLAPAQGVA